MRIRLAAVIVLCTFALAALVFVASKRSPTMTDTTTSQMKIESPALAEGQLVPTKYTCDGEEVSMPLTFSNVPTEAKSLALIFDDPDTSMGTFTHWVVFNIPPETTSVLEEMPRTTPTFGTPGANSGNSTEYIGPCPPSGTHRYIFTLYALDAMLPLPVGASRDEVEQAMNGHVIGTAQLVGKYGRINK